MKLLLFVLLFSQISLNIFAESIATIIDEPGRYYFGLDMTGDPTDPNDTLLEIRVGGVVVNLDGTLFSQSLTSTVTGFSAIRIVAGVSDVSIENGTIGYCTGHGIEIQDGCRLIGISDVDIFGCQEAGIALEGLSTGSGIQDVGIYNTKVVGCKSSQGNAVYGCYIQSVLGLIVEDSLFLENDGELTADGYGLFIKDSGIINLSNVIFSGNAGLTVGIGAWIENTSHCFIRDSIFNANFSRSSIAQAMGAGLVFKNCSNCRVLSSEAISNANPGANALGFCFDGGGKNMLNRCLAESNTGGLTGIGIEFIEQDCSQILDSVSRLNDGPYAAGIKLTGIANNNCFIKNNTVIGLAGQSKSFGIIDEKSKSDNAIILNEAFDFDQNYSVSYKFGISFPLLSASLTNPLIGIPSTPRGAFDNLSISS